MFAPLCTRARSLRRFKSHKDLRAGEDMRSFHARQISESTSSWTSRPSTESGRPSTSRDNMPALSSSSEWDPLRLHPPLDTGRSPNIYPGGRRHYAVDDAERQPPPRNFRELQASASSFAALEIEDGFDFGFAKTPSSTSSATSRDSHTASNRSTRTAPSSPLPAKMPASAWSSPALSSASSSSSSGWDSDETETRARAAAAVTPRHPGNFSTLTTDYLLTRGGWKRRGIVFQSEAAEQPDEDECFEIP